jgi:hypothetical protein
MADERPQTVTLQSPVEVRITNEELPLRQLLTDPQGNPVGAAASGAGVSSVNAEFLVDAAGTPATALAEADATLRGQVVLWDYTGAAQIRAAGEPTTGEARGITCGKDEALNVDDFRTDPNRIQWVRPHEEYVSVASAEIPVAEGDLWAPGLADTIRYLVEFMVINNDAGGAAITGVYVGRDLNAGGGLAAPEYWMFDETINYPGNSGWRGPFYMHGDDAVRGVAAVANDASIIFRVRRVDTGA